jgi:outer membrane biosynthesis protein TonB
MVLLALVGPTAAACGAEPRPASPPSAAVVSVPAASDTTPPPDASAPDQGSPDDPRACLGKCQGRASSELGLALQQRAMQGRRCYTEALRATPTLEGRTVVSVRVGGDGSVCSATVKTSDMPTDVNDCLLGLFQRQTYPPPSGGCIDAEVPLSFKHFVPQQGDAGP